jgi:hypothetical protein
LIGILVTGEKEKELKKSVNTEKLLFAGKASISGLNGNKRKWRTLPPINSRREYLLTYP